MLAVLFSHLYACVPVLSILAYMPQISLLLKSPGPAREICLRSWLLWTIGGLITLGYGAWCLHDRVFCLVTFLSILPMMLMLGIVFYNRHIRRPGGSRAPNSVRKTI